MKTKLVTLLLFLALINLYPQIGGYALKFDGTNDYVTTNFNTQLNIFTIECWVKGNNAPSHGAEASGVVHRDHNFQINWDHPEESYRGAAAIAIGGTWHQASFGTLEANVWYHLAATYDGENLRAYKNGVLINTNTNPSGNPDNPGVNMKIGAHSSVPSSGNYFGGVIDEVRVWDAVRTETEIKTDMYKEIWSNSNLKVYYKMSDGAGNTLTDNSENGVTGTLTNDPLWIASGCFSGSRQALDFDGSDDYVSFTIDNSPSFDQSNTTIRTVEAWIKTTSGAGQEDDIVNWGKSNGGDAIEFRVSAGKLEFGIDAPSNGQAWTAIASNSNVNSGNWTHVAVVKNGTDIQLYVNGYLDRTGTIDRTPLVDILTIGAQRKNNTLQQSYCFPGQIDEIRIWDVARTGSQISENMMTTLSANDTGLIAYYRFDHYNGTNLFDCTGNGYNGTLTNMDPATDWVSSSAFNTWIGSESNAWSTAGNWSKNSAPSATDNVGLYKWNLGNETEISGTPTMNHLLFSSTASPTLSSNFTVDGCLVLQKDIDLNGRQITLGSSGFLSEGNYRFFGNSGTIQTTRNLENISGYDVGGLGAIITAEFSNLGSTTISRGHALQGGGNSIARYYDITPTNNSIFASLTFTYRTEELNGLSEESLRLFKSTDNGTTWTNQGGIPTPANNWVFLSGITSFSRWTLALNESPMPVELSSFNAQVNSKAVSLSWQTETETNNFGFEIERSTLTVVETGHALSHPHALSQSWDVIGFVAGSGNSNSSKDYSFTDKNIKDGTYLYRLKQIDNDGAFNYSKVLEVEIGNTPSDYSLSQNYPNPFNPSTTIRFGLPENSKVVLEIFSLVGEKVATLINNDMEAGYHDYQFSVNEYGLSSGIYFYKLSAGNFTSTKKLVLMK